MHLKQIVNACNWDSNMYNDISTRFLLMYSKQFFSQCNHSKREYGFIYFYLCLAFQPRICQFLLNSTDFAPHVECTLIKIYLIKCTLVYTSAHMLKLYLQSLHNTILASKEFFFQFGIRNKMIQSWNSCNHQFMNW